MSATPSRRSAIGFGAAALFAGLAAPAIASIKPNPAARLTPIAALQRRLTDLCTARHQMDCAALEMPSGPDHDALHERIDENLDDCIAIWDGIVALPAETLEDAAIQAAVAFIRTEGITTHSPEDASDVRDIRASLTSIILAIVKASAIDIDQLGTGDMGHLCALYAPKGRSLA